MTDMNEAVTTADVKHMFEEKYRRGIFNPVARHLREDIAEDRLAEGIAMAFYQYKEKATDGHVMDDALLVHIAHLRSIDLGRRVAGSQGARPAADVYTEANYKSGHVELLHIDGLLDDDGDDEQPLIGWAELEVRNPVRGIVSAIDLERWLLSLDAADRLLLALRQSGHTLGGIAAAVGTSTSTVFKRLGQLGHELAEMAELEVGTRRAS
jgi:hypothetical protein